MPGEQNIHMAISRFTLAPPAGFRFAATVRSHGWYDLPPFYMGDLSDAGPPASIERVLAVEDRAIDVTVSAAAEGLVVEAPRGAPRAAVTAQVSRMLQLDEDLEPFYALTDNEPGLAWARAHGAGRLLRAPTLFEDLIKMLLTTNCSWSLTRAMVGRLVDELGEPSSSGAGRHAFPSAARTTSR
jgi:N-glycosylase/DNA lyase